VGAGRCLVHGSSSSWVKGMIKADALRVLRSQLHVRANDTSTGGIGGFGCMAYTVRRRDASECNLTLTTSRPAQHHDDKTPSEGQTTT
jgi:hypothetical protein